MRIIGGKWRGRKISFAPHDEIRPTPSRIRETLFNWLQGYIHGANCLELYAGSGVLSFESLSRGASSVTLVEHSSLVHSHLVNELKHITDASDAFQCYNTSAAAWVQQPHNSPFQIIYLDPPFAGAELSKILPLIVDQGLLSADGLIYVESPTMIIPAALPASLEIFKQKKAGKVHYCLCRFSHQPNIQ